MLFFSGRSVPRRVAGSVLALVGLTVLAAHGQTLTQLSSVSADANINQSSVTANVTARYTTSSDYRNLTQTFIWNTTGQLTGIGLLVDPGEGAAGTTFGSTSQTYALDIQQLTSAANRTVTSTLTTLTFTMTSSLIAPDKYIYISFDTPLALTNGGVYGFDLRPTAIVAGNAVDIATSSTASTTIYGVGSQGSTVTSGLSSYSNSNIDLTYFTTATAVPEPSTLAMLAGAGGAALFLRRSLRPKNG